LLRCRSAKAPQAGRYVYEKKMIEMVIKFLQFFSLITFFVGLFMLSSLQFNLSRRLNKSLFTFLPVLTFPSNELTDKERRNRKYGGFLLLIGAIAAVLCSINNF
jgi:dolichol kinase